LSYSHQPSAKISFPPRKFKAECPKKAISLQ